MRVEEKLCKAGKRYNEDYIDYSKNYAFVLDGATGLEKNIISRKSDARWYVRKFSKYLKKYIINNDLKDAVTKALKDINKEIKKHDKFINSSINIPSACIAIVKENEENFEFFTLGDCSIIYGNNQNQVLITNQDIRKLDHEKILKMIAISKEKNINISDAYEFIIPDLRNQRLLKNNPGGYYILDIDEDAPNHANYKVIEKENIDMIILLSDGFSSYYENLELEENYQNFFLKNYKTNVKTLYKELRKREKEDKYLNSYPRFHISDDASIIKIKCNIN